jgi:hypothetical protein
MRKNLFYIIAFVLLLAVASVFFFSNSSGNLSLRSSKFAIENTDKIEEIRISGLNSQSILSRENEQWKINNTFLVKEQLIENLLLALNRLEIQYPVSKAEKQQIASLLEKEGILVEIKKSSLGAIKFYVSKPSMSEKTYMMMTRSSEPYVVKIPGFKGQIAQLFVPDENFWRNKIVFDYLPQNISTIIVDYPQSNQKSFRIKNFNDGSFALLDSENKPQQEFNVEKVARYFTYFQKIQFEDIVAGLPKEEADSLIKSIPFIQILVEDIKGGKNEIRIYKKPSDGSIDAFGEKTEFDLNRAYAVLNNNNELLLIQYTLFDPLLKEFDYFR